MIPAKGLLCSVLVISLGGCISARKLPEEHATVAEPKRERFSTPFRLGERLTYEVYYGLLLAGRATLVVQDLVEVCGRPTYHVVLIATTTPAFSKIFRVDDRIETYIDTEEFIPWKFTKVQEEGDYRHDEVTLLDQENHLGHYRSNRSGYTKDYEIPERCQDTLSMFYFLRLLSYDVGERFVMRTMSDERIWEVAFKVKAAQRRTIYRGGSHDTFLVESDASFDAGTLRKERGRLWITTDDRRLIVCIKTKLSFGYLTLAMVKADNIFEESEEKSAEAFSPERN